MRLRRDRRLATLTEDIDLQRGSRHGAIGLYDAQRDRMAHAPAVIAGCHQPDPFIAAPDGREIGRVACARLAGQNNELVMPARLHLRRQRRRCLGAAAAGLLDAQVDVATRGGQLTIAWDGGSSAVMMTGPASTVFEGEIELAEQP